jgi:hypothetical protein
MQERLPLTSLILSMQKKVATDLSDSKKISPCLIKDLMSVTCDRVLATVKVITYRKKNATGCKVSYIYANTFEKPIERPYLIVHGGKGGLQYESTDG